MADPLVIGPILLTKKEASCRLSIELFRVVSSRVGDDHVVSFAVTAGEEGTIKAIELAMPGLTLLHCGSRIGDNAVPKAREMDLPAAIVDQTRKDHKKQFDYKKSMFDDDVRQGYNHSHTMAAEHGCVLAMDRYIAYYKKRIVYVVAVKPS